MPPFRFLKPLSNPRNRFRNLWVRKSLKAEDVFQFPPTAMLETVFCRNLLGVDDDETAWVISGIFSRWRLHNGEVVNLRTWDDIEGECRRPGLIELALLLQITSSQDRQTNHEPSRIYRRWGSRLAHLKPALFLPRRRWWIAFATCCICIGVFLPSVQAVAWQFGLFSSVRVLYPMAILVYMSFFISIHQFWALSMLVIAYVGSIFFNWWVSLSISGR